MADDVNLETPVGMVATDEIGTAPNNKHYQKILLGWGADGVWTRSDTPNPFPVQMRTSTGVEAVPITTVPHGTADAGDPLKTGFRAIAGVSGATLVSAGQRSDLLGGRDGIIYTRPHAPLEDLVTSDVVACTSGANTSIIAALGAGIKFYLCSVVLFNNGTANGNCIIRENTAGTVKLKLPFPASTGTVYNPPVPIAFAANAAVFADPSGSDTIDVTIIGFKSKV